MTGLERPLVHTRTTERGVQISKCCPSPGPSFAALASPSGLPRYPQDPASKGLRLDPAEGFPDPVLELQLVRVGNYFGDPCWPRELEVQGVSLSCCCLGEQAAGALVIWLFWGWMPLSCLSQRRPWSLPSLLASTVEHVGCTMRQGSVVPCDKSSRQSPRLAFVSSHSLAGGTSRQERPRSLSARLCVRTLQL